MADPTLALTTAIENATKVANTTLFTTVIDKVTGFKISKWSAEGEVVKKQIHDEYEIQKNNGIVGTQYVSALRGVTNLVNIGTKSSQYINQEKDNEIKIDNDFFWNTIEHAKSVSNEQMQELIAKIIAGEYNNPETYSMSTLQILKSLGKKEIELFENMCGLLLSDNKLIESLFSGDDNTKEIMSKLGLDFGKLQTLQGLGLYLPNSMKTTPLSNPNKLNFEMKYFDEVFHFKCENENTDVDLPSYYGLSVAGTQILKHLNPKKENSFAEWLKNNYKIPNYKIIK